MEVGNTEWADYVLNDMWTIIQVKVENHKKFNVYMQFYSMNYITNIKCRFLFSSTIPTCIIKYLWD